jgi:ubiquinone/menaquinone biosynthesis C-methylase UbiE
MSSFFTQFAHPRGSLGFLVGHLMAVKNGARSRWALGILEPREGERILEIGFGPGVDVARLARAVGTNGFVGGVDVSREMVRQATARNRDAVAARRVELRLGSCERLPFDDASFDAAYATNSAQFWPDVGGCLAEVRRVLRASGRAVVVVQPMARGATDRDALDWREKLRAGMNEAGFGSVQTKEVHLVPRLTVAVIGVR